MRQWLLFQMCISQSENNLQIPSSSKVMWVLRSPRRSIEDWLAQGVFLTVFTSVWPAIILQQASLGLFTWNQCYATKTATRAEASKTSLWQGPFCSILFPQAREKTIPDFRQTNRLSLLMWGGHRQDKDTRGDAWLMQLIYCRPLTCENLL